MPKQGETVAEFAAGQVRLRFVWQGDRLQHRLSRGTVAIESNEREGFETPVYTELHRQGATAFLSGMSGCGHWSLCVEPTEGEILFDVACRLKSLPAQVGSIYSSWDTSRLQIVGKAAGDSPPPALRTVGGLFTIEPALPDLELPATIRYRYVVASPSSKWIARHGGESKA